MARGRPPKVNDETKAAKTSAEPKAKKAKAEKSGAKAGLLTIEAELWAMAVKLRGSMDAALYKHVALGLLFLKYISDAFEEKHAALSKDKHAEPEDRDEYIADRIFWVPKSARWAQLQARAKQPDIGKIVDNAMEAIEKDNPTLKGVLPKDYANPALDKTQLGKVIDLVSDIGLGGKEHRDKDLMGRVYEYFLSMFASAEGKRGGEFFTPSSIVKTLVEMIAPFKGRIYDPCCGSGGMFVQSEKFVEAHGGKRGAVSVYGQEWNATTWKLAKMNLAIHGIEANLAEQNADTFARDLHKDLKADYILANPPFNISDWGGDKLKVDVRWKYGTPPTGNANFAWVQHMVHHLAPAGIAGIVLANGSMSSNQSGEGDIRKALVQGDMVDCMVSLPGQLFYSTQIPVCLWFLSKARQNGLGMGGNKMRDRRGEVLFIDARKMGRMDTRVNRVLDEADIQKIASTYHKWRGDDSNGKYEDVKGFCKAASLKEIEGHGFVLTPGRYVGAEDIEEDDVSFEERMAMLGKTLSEQFGESDRLSALIKTNLKQFGIDFGTEK
jgi:type I restriction enzyme M protein